MRIEPIYLLGQRPEPPSIPTRRAFLFIGSSFVVGLGLGGACGYSLGASSKGGDGKGDPEPELEPSGNAELDELRRLAVKAPIEELVEQWIYFIDLYSMDYRKDPVLPKGVERLATFAETTPGFDQRRVLARALIDVISRGEPSLRTALEHKIPTLDRIR